MNLQINCAKHHESKNGKINLFICRRVKKLRLERDMTQTEVAAHVGISRNKYARCEAGKWDFSATVLQRLAEFFCKDINFFLYEDKDGEGYLHLDELEWNLIVTLRTYGEAKDRLAANLLENFAIVNQKMVRLKRESVQDAPRVFK